MEAHTGEKKLKQVTSKKVLGVTIDDQLSWEEQVDNISKKGISGHWRAMTSEIIR